MKQGEVVAGVDIGGTKTHLLIKNSQIVADRTVPTSDWRNWDREHDAAALAALILETADGAPAATAIGAHGCDSNWQCKQLEADLATRLGGRIRVVNDAELLVPAAGLISGVGVVSGTGSIAVARTARDEMLVAGGWGWILGDEGSAAALVREAARAVRGSLDLGESNDSLVDALMSKLKTDDPTKIGRLLNEVRAAAVWGSYADAVFDAAKAGSRLASKVIDDGAQALAGLIAILAGRGADASQVVIGGSVAVEQPRLFEAFVAATAKVSPRSQVTLLKEPPVRGAINLAERLGASVHQG